MLSKNCNTKGTRGLCLNIPLETYAKLKQNSAKEYRSLTGTILLAIEKFLENYDNND